MKGAPFEYFAPGSLSDAISILDSVPDARVLAGGQSLIPLMNARALTPSAIVDIKRINILGTIEEKDGRLELGAAVKQRSVELTAIQRGWPTIVAEMASSVGSVGIRNRGTVLGSLAHADPAAEWPVAFLALDGTCRVQGPGGQRDISASDLFVGPGTTSLKRAEVMTSASLALPGPGVGSAWEEFAPRAGDLPIVGCAAIVVRDDLGGIARCSIGLGGAGPTPLRMDQLQERLLGARSIAEIERAVGASDGEMDPLPTVHADASFRRRIAIPIMTRAIRRALERATGARS